MAYISTLQKPSSVRFAVKAKYLSPDDECLILAKVNRLEIYEFKSRRIRYRYSSTIFGRITLLYTLPCNSGQRDQLFIGTDQNVYFIVAWGGHDKPIQTKTRFAINESKPGRYIHTNCRAHLDQCSRYLLVESYEGIIGIFPINFSSTSPTSNSNDTNIEITGKALKCRIAEHSIISSTFIHSDVSFKSSKYAVLFEDFRHDHRVRIKHINYTVNRNPDDPGTVEVEDVKMEGPDGKLYNNNLKLDFKAKLLLPVHIPPYGVFIVSENFIYWLDTRSMSFTKVPVDPPASFCTWIQIHHCAYILASEAGGLYSLKIKSSESCSRITWKLKKLTDTSRASCLVYLGSGVLFIGSHFSRSHTLNLANGKLTFLQTLANIAPTLDFGLFNATPQTLGMFSHFLPGHARLITGSGAWNMGSICSVESKVGVTTLSRIERDFSQVFAIFSLQSPNSLTKDTLVMSCFDYTVVVNIDESMNITEFNEFHGFDLSLPTLLATNLAGSKALQVTLKGVIIVDLNMSGPALCMWNIERPGSRITSAATNGEVVAICIGGTELISLRIVDLSELGNSGVSVEFIAQRSINNNEQVSCIHLPLGYPGITVVGYWNSECVEFCDTFSFRELRKIAVRELHMWPDGPLIIRSVMLCRIYLLEETLLLIGLSNGVTIICHINWESFNTLTVQVYELGHEAVHFIGIPREVMGVYQSIFVVGQYPGLIYADIPGLKDLDWGKEKRLHLAAVGIQSCRTGAIFGCQSKHKSGLATLNGNMLSLLNLDAKRSTFVRMIKVGETVRRMASPSNTSNILAIGTVQRQGRIGEEVMSSRILLADRATLTISDVFPLRKQELVEALTWGVLRSGDACWCVVGTTVVGSVKINDRPAVRGRLIILRVIKTTKLQWQVITDIELRTACRCVAIMSEKIVAGLVKTVAVFRLISTPDEQVDEKKYGVEKVGMCRVSTVPVDVTVCDKRSIIGVADLLQSLSVYKFRGDGTISTGNRLREIARHTDTVWSVTIAKVNEDMWIESDAEGNLLLLAYPTTNQSSVNTMFTKVNQSDPHYNNYEKVMNVEGEFNLGEMVNRMRPIEASQCIAGLVTPRVLLATAEGSIYLVSTLDAQSEKALLQLQRNLAKLITCPGDLDFERFRSFYSVARQSERSLGFIDSNLVQRYWSCSSDIQSKALQGVSLQQSQLEHILRVLQRLE